MMSINLNIKIPFFILLMSLFSGCFNHRSPNDIEKKWRMRPSTESAWWHVFQDAALNDWVEEAIQHNLGYQIAIKNIEIAKTHITQNESALLPSVNAGYSFSRNRLKSLGGSSAMEYNAHQLQGSVSYEVDLWGKLKNTVKQSESDWAVAHFGAEVVRLTLVSGVISNYFLIRSLHFEIKNLKKQQLVLKENLHLLNAQSKGGLIDDSTIWDLKNNMESNENTIRTYMIQEKQAMHALAALLGKTPQNFQASFAEGTHFDLEKVTLPENISSDWVKKRPDVQQALHQMVSARYFKKVNDTNYLPQFGLTGAYGYQSSALTNFLSTPNLIWNFGLNILQPIFDADNRKSQRDRARVQFESSILNYRSTVIQAFQEMSDALVAYQNDRENLKALGREVRHAMNKLNELDAQFKAGLVDNSKVMAQKGVLLQLELNEEAARLQVIQDIIQAQKAFGYFF